MKRRIIPFIIFVITSFAVLHRPVISQEIHTNNITIRNDRVFELNGQPFFPIFVNFELGPDEFNCQLFKANGEPWGFNIINLHIQSAWMFNCFGGFSACNYGYKIRNIISGDLNTGSQYKQLLLPMGWDITWQDNANRIFNYIGNNQVYLFSDGFAFFPNTVQIWKWNYPGYCGDSVVLAPRFNQTVRNEAIDRINYLSTLPNSKLIGFYSMDDAMGMHVDPPDESYFWNNIDEEIQNLVDSYDHAKSVWPQSAVIMPMYPFFYPRIVNPSGWSINAARSYWKYYAHKLAKGGDIFPGGFDNMEAWSSNFWIYENPQPMWYVNHLDTMWQQVLAGYTSPKAMIAGNTIDVDEYPPNDPLLERKFKWQTYVGLLKGCTGLGYHGWFLAHAGSPYTERWEMIKNMVDTLANIKNLDELVFTKTNFGPTGYAVNGTTSSNISYAIYQNDLTWDDYYLLATNNPNGSYYGPAELDNDITFKCDVHTYDTYTIQEVFSNDIVTPITSTKFSYTLPWFGTALFHLSSGDAKRNMSSKPKSSVPSMYYINQNYPNPFNPKTKITYGIPKDGNVTIRLYNGLGQLIIKLIDEYETAGEYKIIFDGSKSPSGIYFYVLESGDFRQTKKMLLIK